MIRARSLLTPLFLLAALALGIWLAMVLLERGGGGAGADPAGRTLASREAPRGEPELAATEPQPPVQREAAAEVLPALAPSPRTVALTGAVRCALTGGPLAARVELADVAVRADADEGRFVIRAALEGESALWIAAEGYTAAEVLVEPHGLSEDLGVVQLAPAEQARVIVREAGGAPVEGAEVSLVGIGTMSVWGERQGRSLGFTDETGRLLLAIGREELVIATRGQRCSAVAIVRPGTGEIELFLGAGDGPGFGLVDSASGAPLAGVDLIVERIEGYPPQRFEARTGADGRIGRPLPPGRYRVEEPDKRILFTRTPGAPVDRHSSAISALVDIEPGGDAVWLAAELRKELHVVAHDADTGERLAPLHAWREFFEVMPGETTGRWMRLGGETFVAEDGEFSVYRIHVLFSSGGPRRLCLSVPGYRPATIEDVRDALQPEAEPHRVELARAPRRSLRLLTSAGAPYPHRVWVREGEQQALAFAGLPDPSGALGPLGWNGEALALHSGPRLWSPVLAEVDIAALAAADEVDVQLGGEGAVEIAVPRGVTPRLYAASSRSERYSGSLQGGLVRFDALPAGGYEVGPQELLDTISLREHRGHAVFQLRVEAGQTTRVAWDPAWAPPDVIPGRVSTPDMEGVPLWVVPRFGPSEVPLGHTGRAARFPVHQDGTFELRGLGMWPTRLMFARQDEKGDLVPIGVGAPGEDAELLLARVFVAWKGLASGEVVCVSCVPVVAGLRTLGVIQGCGPRGERIDLGWIPFETPFLELVHAGRRRRVPMQLIPGETVTIEVEPSGAESSPR